MKEILSESDQSRIAHALRVAAEVFAKDAATMAQLAKDASQTPGARAHAQRLTDAFHAQQTDALGLAHRFEAADSVCVYRTPD